MSLAMVIPSLGAESLAACLEAVAALEPSPDRVIVVLSGGADLEPRGNLEVIRFRHRLGFAAAVNAGIEAVRGEAQQIALLNDDAIPAPGWLDPLVAALAADAGLAAVQSTITDASGELVDGRGITLDEWGLPVQVDHRSPAAAEPARLRPLLGISGTAALLRAEALAQVALPGGAVFDHSLGSYHEDLDLALRLRRLGWRAAWVPGPPCRHLGSLTARAMSWRHPWWILANRWRVLAGNLEVGALLRLMPRLIRGEVRAVHTLARHRLRVLLVAAAVAILWPWLVVHGLCRHSPSARLKHLPCGSP